MDANKNTATNCDGFGECKLWMRALSSAWWSLTSQPQKRSGQGVPPSEPLLQGGRACLDITEAPQPATVPQCITGDVQASVLSSKMAAALCVCVCVRCELLKVHPSPSNGLVQTFQLN